MGWEFNCVCATVVLVSAVDGSIYCGYTVKKG
jgi:hypothetical protein